MASDRPVYASFAVAVFLCGKGCTPTRVLHAATGVLYEFPGDAEPAWQEYARVKAQLNRMARDVGDER